MSNIKINSFPRISDDEICSGVTYRCSDGSIDGISNTIRRILGNESYGQEKQVREKLGLQEGDILLQIDSFHPNGIHYCESEMRKGRGKSFLTLIEQEAKNIGAKGIYTWALTEYMKTFMEKNNFNIELAGESQGKKHYLCYKKEATS